MLDRIRAEHGPFDSDEDLLLATFFMPELLEQLRAAGPMPLEDPVGNSIVEIVRQTAASGTRSLRLVRHD